MILVTPEIVSILLLDFIFLSFGSIALFIALKIIFYWDSSRTTTLQYTLEKQSFLAATIIKYILAIKIPIFLFFIFTQDKLSNVIPGAMCAAGVINSTVYGFYLLVLKIAQLYLFASWLVLHSIDSKNDSYKFVKIKFIFYVFIFFILLLESIFEVLMFSSIDASKIVSCCGTLFSAAKTSYFSSIFLLPHSIVIGSFYGSFFLVIISYFLRKKIKIGSFLFMKANLLFILTSLVSLIIFFSTYVYELPTHNCPFCLLQKDYYYMGYFIYIFLFLGTFLSIANYIKEKTSFAKMENLAKFSLIFDTIYVLIVSAYPILFYFKNGTWL